MKDATIVTAFYDIGRSEWESSMFRRSVDDYISAFSNLLKFDYPMIVFVDRRHYERVKNLVDSSEHADNKMLIPIDEEWLSQNIWAWSRLGREREIMQSEEYRSLIPHRVMMQYPENVKPEYTILTHSKIDFMNHVIDHDLCQSNFLMWVDFGYLSPKAMASHIPHRHLNPSKMIDGRVILCCLNGGISNEDRDAIYTLKAAPEKIAAGLFVGDRDAIKKFQRMSHQWLLRYQEMNLADDEQALWIQCLFEDPSLFALHIFPGWYDSLKYFTKDSI